jgi:lipid-A-disaccharide synthase
MKAATAGWQVAPLLLPNTEDKKDFFAAATAAIAKSGTIGLECSLAGLPSMVAYRASALTAFMVRRMIRIPYVHLANLLAKRMIIPELIQEDCTPANITATIQPLLVDAAARDAQKQALAGIAAMLGVNDSQSPSEKAAETILQLLH